MTVEFPRGGLIGKAASLVKRLNRMNIPLHAANAGFFMVLSLFPMLVLLLSTLRYTDLDARDLLQLVEAYIPAALYDAVERLVIQTYAYSGAAVVSLSAAGALWSSSRGLHGILRGLNGVYGVQEDRGWLYTRTISVFYTVGFLTVLIVGLALNVFGEFLPFLRGLADLRFVLMMLLQTALFALMYAVLPNRPNRFAESLPGAVLASVGWLVFTRLFSLYVEKSGGYSNIYGSVYALALGMLWIYCCLCILFYGAALNQLLEEKKTLP